MLILLFSPSDYPFQEEMLKPRVTYSIILFLKSHYSKVMSQSEAFIFTPNENEKNDNVACDNLNSNGVHAAVNFALSSESVLM